MLCLAFLPAKVNPLETDILSLYLLPDLPHKVCGWREWRARQAVHAIDSPHGNHPVGSRVRV